MTQDELVELTEALLEQVGFTLATLRYGEVALEGLSDEQFLLATRFVAGERPKPTIPIPSPVNVPQERRTRGVELSEDEMARRLAAVEELEEETPHGLTDIGDGVEIY
jgi:hypothetical protein